MKRGGGSGAVINRNRNNRHSCLISVSVFQTSFNLQKILEIQMQDIITRLTDNSTYDTNDQNTIAAGFCCQRQLTSLNRDGSKRYK